MSQRKHTERMRSQRRAKDRAKKSLSSPFMCLRCGYKSFNIQKPADGTILGRCSNCYLEIKSEFPSGEEIDDYSRLVDIYAERTTTENS